MANVLVNENSLSAIADAIRAKAGSVDTFKPAEMAAAIAAIPTGAPEEPPRKDVNFYNYDGKRLYSYTREEIQAMTALPEYPGEEGITFVEWNWSLAGLKAHNGRMNVGACCVANGNTSIIYGHADVQQEVTITIFGQHVAGEIDWGDGTVQTYDASPASEYLRRTLGIGDHVIKVMAESATIGFENNSIVVGAKFAATHKANDYDHCHRAKWNVGGDIKAPNAVGYSAVCFIYPRGVTSAGSCSNKGALKHICFCEDVTSVGSGNTAFQNVVALEEYYTPLLTSAPVFYVNRYAFGINALQDIYVPYNGDYPTSFASYSSYAMSDILVPEGVTGLSEGCFRGSYPARITLPATLTSLATTGFYPAVVVFKGSTPPTVSSSSALGVESTLKKILVPAGSLSAYQAATNLSQYAAVMEEY